MNRRCDGIRRHRPEQTTLTRRLRLRLVAATKATTPKNAGTSHHPLLAFCADWRLVANFWLRSCNTNSSNNVLAFLEATLANLGATTVGLVRAGSGFYCKAIVAFLKGCKINHVISARLTQALQQTMVFLCQWQDDAPGLQISELRYQPHGWEAPQRLVVIRQYMHRKAGGVPGKTQSLFDDDPDLTGCGNNVRKKWNLAPQQ